MFARYKIIIYILIGAGFLSAEAFTGNIRIAAIRVEFPTDNNEGTSGDGTFLLINSGNYCKQYTIDPPPHNKSYFQSQLKAVNNYYNAASKGNFGIDLNYSEIFPASMDGAYLMPNEMGYYHPLAADLDEDEKLLLHEERIVEMFKDALTTAFQEDNINFVNFDLVVVFHAGISQDFRIDLDITPEDIPSTYIDENMIADHISASGINIGGTYIRNGIILPETQNHIFYSDFVEQYQQNGIQDVCQFQYGLTGTFAMLIGQAIGLPPLWNTDTGQSGVGVFGLMDQGSNNGYGLIPALPSAWSRIFAGWEKSRTGGPGQSIDIKSQPKGEVLRINLNENEYFLIENRTNWYRENVGLDSAQYAVYSQIDTVPNIIEFIFDSIGVEFDENQIVVNVPDYDIGLPGSGLLIWHIDEGVINKNITGNSINNDPKYKGVDIEEAGGPQDIGYVSTALFRDPSIGEPYDMWYSGNLEYRETNPAISNLIEFGPYTFPDTRSNNGAKSYLSIGNIGKASDTMRISVSNSLILSGFSDSSSAILYFTDFDNDGNAELLGGKDSLWWKNINSNERQVFYKLPSDVNYFVITNSDDKKNLAVLSEWGDSLLYAWFEFNETFILKKKSIEKNVFDPIDHIVGSTVSDHVYNSYRNDRIDLKNTANGEHAVASFWDTGGIALYNISDIYNDIIFTYISAVDLDLDGNIEVLGLNEGGEVFAIEKSGNYANGFPINYAAKAPILAKDIIGDDHPELIFKNNDGDLLIFNYIGELQYRLIGNKNSSLVMLSEHNGRNAVVTETNIWIFDEIGENNGNEWIAWHGDEINSTTIEITYLKPISSNGKIFDKNKTYVYPNPVKNNAAKIRLQNYSAEKIEIKIYDSAGYLVDEINKNIDNSSGIWETTWDVSKINSGVYFLKLNAHNGNNEESIIIKVGVIH